MSKKGTNLQNAMLSLHPDLREADRVLRDWSIKNRHFYGGNNVLDIWTDVNTKREGAQEQSGEGSALLSKTNNHNHSISMCSAEKLGTDKHCVVSR